MSIIYRITNIINGKSYIGLTTKSLEKRWSQHCYQSEYNKKNYIHKAIKKYGKENFTKEILEKVDDHLLEKREEYWIDYYNTFNKNGYNMTSGGEINKEITQELRDKISKANKNRIHTKESRLKKSISSTGKKQSKETIEKRIKNMPDTTGRNHWNWGNKHKESTIKLMKEKRKLQAPIDDITKNKMSLQKKNKIAAYDLIDKKHILITKEEFQNKERYCGRTSKRISKLL